LRPRVPASCAHQSTRKSSYKTLDFISHFETPTFNQEKSLFSVKRMPPPKVISCTSEKALKKLTRKLFSRDWTLNKYSEA
jgi:hypothetical protein